MIINKDTEMLLFRYSNYKKYSFLKEHESVLERFGYTWFLKMGRKSNIDKINSIKDNGGWLVLRAPKADGGHSYLARFIDVQEDKPTDLCFPNYYNEILDGNDDMSLYLANSSKQWFKLNMLIPLENDFSSSLVITKTGKKVDDVISTTRTAVMFVQNNKSIELEVK